MKKIIICVTICMFMFRFIISAHAVEVQSLGVDIHGFVSQGFLKSTNYNYLTNDSNKGSFQFNEMGINFGKQVTDQLRIGAQFFARDLGDVANNKVTLDWAYGDYRFRDWLGVRAGRIKIPFGLYGDIRDMDMLRACVILPQGVYNEHLRDTMIALNGAALYGTIPLSVAGSLEYQAQVGVGNVDAESGAGKYLENSLRLRYGQVHLSSFNTKTTYNGSLRWNTPLPGLALKGTLLWTESDMPMALGATSFTLNMKNFFQVYSAEFIWKNLTLAAEYLTCAVDLAVPGISMSQRIETYYGMGSYRFTRWLEAGMYYSENYPDAGERNGDNYNAPGQHNFWAWQKDAALFVRFDVNDYLALKLEGHYVDGASAVMIVDNPTRDDKNWWYFAAKATFSF